MTGWIVLVRLRYLGERGYATLMPFDVAIQDQHAAINAVSDLFSQEGVQVSSSERLSESAITALGLKAGEIRQRR
jgi:hypothetical protein